MWKSNSFIGLDNFKFKEIIKSLKWKNARKYNEQTKDLPNRKLMIEQHEELFEDTKGINEPH